MPEANTKQESLVWYCCGVLLFPLRVLLGCFAFTAGVCCNFCVETCGCANKKSSKREQESWRDTRQALSKFLEESGLQDELSDGMNARLLSNLRVINAIQRKLYPFGRPNACRMDNPPAMMIDLPKAHRMMKFATAAYGPQVIANAVFESGERMPPAPTASTRSAVMKHVGIENNDENIVVMDLDAGEDLEYLRHYCVIDHAHKAVVLAVRGTLSISSTMVNCAGYCDDFLCDGTKAHSGMAKMTRGIWNKSTMNSSSVVIPWVRVLLDCSMFGSTRNS
jgi:hypothetical protein